MPIYTDPAGREYDVPDDPTPGESAQIRAMNLTPKGEGRGSFMLRDNIKSAISGAAEGPVRGLLVGGDLTKLALHGINKIVPETISESTVDRFGSQPWIDAFRQSTEGEKLRNAGVDLTYAPQTSGGRYSKAGAGAITSAATMGGLGSVRGLLGGASGLNAAGVSLSPAMIAINGLTGLAGELAYDASRKFDETKPGNPLVAAIAAMLTGAGGNAVRQAFAPNLNQVVHNATKGMSDKEWQAAQQELGDFAKSGSSTYTLADLPSLQPRIGGLARGMSNQTGGDLLQQKLSHQVRVNTDIPKLMKEVAEGTTPGPVDPREVARLLSEKAGARIAGAEKARTNALLGNLEAAGNVNPADLLKATNQTVRNAMRQPGNQGIGTRRALDEAERALIGKDPSTFPGGFAPMIAQVNPPVLNVRALSTNVKSLNDMPTRGAGNARTAIRNSDRALASQAADEALKRASPGYAKAMQQYGDTTEHLIKPLELSLTGAVKDAKDFNGVLERLRKVPVDKLQAEINTMGLSDPEVLQLAKAVGGRLKPVPSLVNEADLADRRIFEKLVDYVDPDLASQLGKKLSTADALSRLSSELSAATDVTLNMGKNPVATAVSPFGEVNLRSRLRTSAKETSNLSELIGNPTPENLRRLQELSRIDPRAKRALEWLSTAAASSAALQSDK